MKYYLSQLGYKYTSKDDVLNKEFSHVNTDIEIDEDTSVLGNKRELFTSQYQLFLTNYDKSLVHKKLNDLYDLCNNMTSKKAFDSDYENGKSYYLFDVSVQSEQQENGTLLILIFTIREL